MKTVKGVAMKGIPFPRIRGVVAIGSLGIGLLTLFPGNVFGDQYVPVPGDGSVTVEVESNPVVRVKTGEPSATDEEPPAMTVTGEDKQGGRIQTTSLKRLRIKVQDKISGLPKDSVRATLGLGEGDKPIPVTLTPHDKQNPNGVGPPNKKTYEIQLKDVAGLYEKFEAFDPRKSQSLKMKVFAQDYEENQGKKTFTIAYNPPRQKLGQVRYPHTSEDSPPWTLQSPQINEADQIQLQKSSELLIKLGEGASSSLIVSGETIEPGQLVSVTNFEVNGPHVQLPVKAPANKKAGSHPILIKVATPGGMALVGDIHTWKPGVSLASKNDWKPRRFTDTASLASKLEGPCTFTRSAEQAKEAHYQAASPNKSKCQFRWTDRPASLSVSSQDGFPLKGRILRPSGEDRIAWRIAAYGADGKERVLDTGKRELQVRPPKAHLATGQKMAKVGRGLTWVDTALKPSTGPEWPVFLDNEDGRMAAAERDFAYLVEVQELPRGLHARGETQPHVQGVPKGPIGNEAQLGWKLAIRGPQGNIVREFPGSVQGQSMAITAPDLGQIGTQQDLAEVDRGLTKVDTGLSVQSGEELPVFLDSEVGRKYAAKQLGQGEFAYLVDVASVPNGIHQVGEKLPRFRGLPKGEAGTEAAFEWKVAILGPEGIVRGFPGDKQTMPMAITQIAPLTLSPEPDQFLQGVRNLQSLDRDRLGLSLEPTEGAPGWPVHYDSKRGREIAQRRARERPRYLAKWLKTPAKTAQNEKVDTRPALAGWIRDAGEATFEWQVRTRYAGTTVKLAPQQVSIPVEPPPTPEITLSDSRTTVWLDDEHTKLAVPTDTTLAGVIKGSVPAGEVVVRTEGLAEQVQETAYADTGYQEGNRFLHRLWLTDTDEVGTVRDVKMTVSYGRVGNVATKRNISVYRVPPEREDLRLEGPEEVDNRNDLTLNLSIGEWGEKGLSYDPERQGKWRVQIGQLVIGEDGHRQFESVAEPQVLDGDGKTRLTLDPAELGGSSTLVARATPMSVPDGYDRVLRSNRYYVQVFRGAEPEADMAGRRLQGPAPFRAVFRLELEEMSKRILGNVTWQAKPASADADAEWQIIGEGHRQRAIGHTFEEGRYKLRAKVTNRRTDEVGYTNSVEVHSYPRVNTAIQGPKLLLEGDSAQLTAKVERVSNVGGGEVANPVVEWYRAPFGEERVKIGEGTSVRVQFEEGADNGRRRFVVRARAPQSPTDGDYAWDENRHSIQFRQVRAPYARINGPYRTEVGREYSFDVAANLPYFRMKSDRYTIGHAWELPSGEEVNGESLTWSPKDKQAEKRFVTLKHRVWLKGYRQDGAERVVEHRVAVNRYVFPEFDIAGEANIGMAPGKVRAYAAKSTDGKRVLPLEEPQYDWHLPDAAEMVASSGPRAVIRFKQPGDHTVKLTVTDARDHKAIAERTYSFEAPPPYQVEGWYQSKSNRFGREPLDVTLAPQITGGHPYDRLVDFTYRVEGADLPDGAVSNNGVYGFLRGLPAGEYTVHFNAKSEIGETLHETYEIEVAGNQKPDCELKVSRQTSYATTMKADCTDPDGYIRSYRWKVGDGDPRAGSRMFRVHDSLIDHPVGVTVWVTDDGGGTTRAQQVVKPFEGGS